MSSQQRQKWVSQMKGFEVYSRYYFIVLVMIMLSLVAGIWAIAFEVPTSDVKFPAAILLTAIVAIFIVGVVHSIYAEFWRD